MAHEAILREGYAYVGVNVQKVGVSGVQKLKQFGDRYANASIPDDDISYDIFSQTAQALRDHASGLLGPLKPT
ncbi:alpha/beta hydrolase domain-containing protein, partial [Klebsiella pneumoniae]|nr:alpha/beta hydrolase domain-containing protein [Klebsiella pneumoniae]